MLFLSDARLFVDDVEAYEKYQREEEPDVALENVEEKSVQGGASSSMAGAAEHPEEPLSDDDDDDELDMDELKELEASLSRTYIQIWEPCVRVVTETNGVWSFGSWVETVGQLLLARTF